MVPSTISYRSSDPKLPRKKTASSANSPARKQLASGGRIKRVLNHELTFTPEYEAGKPPKKRGLRIPITRGMAGRGRRKRTNNRGCRVGGKNHQPQRVLMGGHHKGWAMGMPYQKGCLPTGKRGGGSTGRHTTKQSMAFCGNFLIYNFCSETRRINRTRERVC